MESRFQFDVKFLILFHFSRYGIYFFWIVNQVARYFLCFFSSLDSWQQIGYQFHSPFGCHYFYKNHWRQDKKLLTRMYLLLPFIDI